MTNFYLSIMMFLCGGFSLFNNKHILCMLLGLELMMLSFFFLLSSLLTFNFCMTWLLMFYLFVVVCESVLGIGLIINLSRNFGSDLFFSMNLLQ